MFPDCSKSVHRGVIRALGIQYKGMLVNFSGYVCSYIPLLWLLPFKLGLGVTGIWVAKLIMESYIFIAYSLLLYCENWRDIIEKVKK